MRKFREDRRRPIALMIVALLALAACTRSGPPAPVSQHVIDRPALSADEARSRSVTVQQGDTVYAIARRSGVTLRALIDANGLTAPFQIKPGDRLVLPGAVIATRTTTAPVAAAPRGSVETSTLPPPATAPRVETQAAPAAAIPSAGPAPRPAPPVAAAPARAARSFLWPVRGNVISEFGSKPGGLQNDGINIAAPQGTPVRAAENGVVVFAGNQLKGFGNLLLLRHADGWTTAYAHLDEIAVERGQSVKRGQTVGKIGQSGGVASPQLHFEVRRGTRPVDPRQHLSGGALAAAE
jgi:murein DD-endopeptidase MepM/ murein hydrolase activator NlpD